MNRSTHRFDFLDSAQLSCFIGILFSCFTGILLIGAPLELAASKAVSVQLIFLSEFVSWLPLFGGGALLAAVGAWGSYFTTPGHQPIQLRSIIAVAEIAAVVVAIAAALVLSSLPEALGESWYGKAQPDVILFFVGVVVIALSTSLATWRFREGLVKGIATTAALFVLGAFTAAMLAMTLYLVFGLSPSF
jgi:hypothetical protein